MRVLKQMTLGDICCDVLDAIQNNKPELIVLLEEHIDFGNLIPASFVWMFYRRIG